MDAIWQTLVQTPWWVYVLLIYLVKIGIKASHTSVVPIFKMFIIPIIFTCLSIHTLLISFAVTANSIGTWGGSILLGSLVGWVLVSKQKYRVDRAHKLIEIEGNWLTLVLVLIIFCSKYYFGYALSADPGLIKNTNFEYLMLGVSGVCTGLFIGRALHYLKQFMTLTSVDLSTSDHAGE